MATSSTFDTSNTYVKYNITVNVNSQNISNNTSNITVTVRFWRSNQGYETYGTGNVYCGINGTSYSQAVSSSQRITSSGIDLFSRTVDIGHNADGSKTIWCSAYISLNTPLSSSDQGFNVTLPTIPRASSVSGGSGNIGSTSIISISRASSSFTHILYYSFGSISWRWIASNVGTSYSWTLPNDLYGQIPNANSGAGTMICETYSGNTYIGTAYSNFTANVTNSNPSFSENQLTYKDSNTTITAITGNDQLIVQNKSTLSVTFTAATAQNSATISKYQTIFNGVTTDRTSVGTYSFGALNVSQNLTLQVKAIDSRGNSTTISKTVQILGWQPPVADIQLYRQNNYEDLTYTIVTANISSVGGKNSLVEIRRRRRNVTSGAEWLAWGTLTNGAVNTLVCDKNAVWEYHFEITDKFATTTYYMTLTKGVPIFFFDTEKLSIGVNCFPAKSSSFEVNGKNIFDMVYPVGSIYLSVSSVNPSALFGGTWAAWGSGRVPVGVNSSDSDFSSVEKTGGSKYLQSHNHTISMDYTDSATHSHSGRTNILAEGIGTNRSGNYSTSNAIGWTGDGGSQNLQPFITCYMFKRTA